MNKNFPLQGLRLRAVAAFAGLAFVAVNAWAVEPFTVRDIRIEGLQRVEPGTVFASLPVRVGDRYDDEKGSAAIRSLFGLGLFNDVRLEVNGDVLVVVVQEQPTVADIDIAGSREFDKETLRKAMREVGLAEGRPFDKALADRAEQELKRQYINKSLYGSDVVTTITPIERNRVNVTFTVTEGEPARITELRIVGNQGLFRRHVEGPVRARHRQLAELVHQVESLRARQAERRPGSAAIVLSVARLSGIPHRLDAGRDLARQARHFDHRERLGRRAVRRLQRGLEGNFLGRDNEFKSLVAIQPGEPYNADRVAQTTKAFSDLYSNFGYAFAKVEARPEIDRANNRVAIVLQGDPLRRVYVRRINVSGNTRTRDEVVRREFRQFESSWYDGRRIRHLARPGRPARLFPRSAGRNAGRARFARSGRPDRECA